MRYDIRDVPDDLPVGKHPTRVERPERDPETGEFVLPQAAGHVLGLAADLTERWSRWFASMPLPTTTAEHVGGCNERCDGDTRWPTPTPSRGDETTPGVGRGGGAGDDA